MNGTFSPEITEILDIGVSILRGYGKENLLRKPLQRARDFHLKSKAYFQEWIKYSILLNVDNKTLIRQINELFAQRAGSLSYLEAYVINENMQDLMSGLDNLYLTSNRIMSEINTIEVSKTEYLHYSGLPVINDLIIMGKNALLGEVTINELQERMPLVNEYIESLVKELENFFKNYPEEKELVKNFALKLKNIKDISLKLVEEYFEKQDRTLLEQAFKLLREDSKVIIACIKQIETIRKEKGLAINTPLDSFLRTAQRYKEGTDSREDFLNDLSILEEMWQILSQKINETYVSSFIMTYNQKKCEQAIQDANLLTEDFEAVKELDITAENYDSVISKFKDKFENFIKSQEAFFDSVFKETDLSFDPMTDQLRTVIKGVYHQIAPQLSLEQALNYLYSVNQNYQLRMKELPLDEQVQKAEERLRQQQSAYEEVNQFFFDYDKTHLLKGLEEIEDLAKRLRNIEAFITKKDAERYNVSCLQCQHSNPPDANACERCGAIMVSLKELGICSMVEISEGENVLSVVTSYGYAATSDYRRLRKLIGDIISGIEDVKSLEDMEQELTEFFEEYAKKIDNVQQEFEKHVAPFVNVLKKDKNFQEKAKEFREIFVHLEQVLQDIYTYYEDRDTKHLDVGLSRVLNAGDSLMQLQQEIKEIIDILMKKELGEEEFVELPREKKTKKSKIDDKKKSEVLEEVRKQLEEAKSKENTAYYPDPVDGFGGEFLTKTYNKK